MAVYQVIARRLGLTSRRSLTDLIKMLEPGLPRTNTMQMAAKRVRDGKIAANFYTDGWPEFSTVVCQIISPRLSDESDLLCHSTSKDGLLHVMEEAELITWGRWQIIDMTEASHADYLVENLKPPCWSETKSKSLLSTYHLNQYYLPGNVQGQDKLCPEGFVLGKLEPQHLDHVVSQWYQDMKDQCRYQQCYMKYFDHMIRHCESAAIFRADELVKPVAWGMQYPYGLMGHGFTHKDYRSRGFQSLVMKRLVEEIKANGDLPEVNTLGDHSTLRKLGFIYMYQTTLLEAKRKSYLAA